MTPGFIDIHTHFDASLFWDPFCDPMPLHGVTSLLYGNCSLSLAPCRAENRDELSALLCYIEDLPEAAIAEAVPWTWERYPELVTDVGSREFGLNVAGLVGHTPLRLFVLAAEAWERPATDDERAKIAELAEEWMQAGAFGMSTSIGFGSRSSFPTQEAHPGHCAPTGHVVRPPQPGEHMDQRDVRRPVARAGAVADGPGLRVAG